MSWYEHSWEVVVAALAWIVTVVALGASTRSMNDRRAATLVTMEPAS